jgi:hypothetical protein
MGVIFVLVVQGLNLQSTFIRLDHFLTTCSTNSGVEVFFFAFMPKPQQ